LLDLFRQRIALGKSDRGRVLKLALSSVYGKLAQTVGRPRYASRIWAGMITSGTRAQLLRLICQHSCRKNVIALATDGLYSTEALDLPPAPLAPDTLGAWECEPHGPMVFVRPGIYWSERDDTIRARGLGRRTLDAQRSAVLGAIERGEWRALAGTSTAFGSARACVYRTGKNVLKRSQYYGQWHDLPARISLDPRPKRRPYWTLHRLTGIESEAYTKAGLSDDAKVLQIVALLRSGALG
jgi:hypothetical protein